MKFKLIKILTLVFFLLFFIFLIVNFKNLLENFIEDRFSKITEHRVKLSLNKFNLFSGTFELNKIEIENKKNFFNQNIFEAKTVIIRINSRSYFRNPVIIQKVIFSEPKIFFEIKNIVKKKKEEKIQDNLKIIEKINNKEEPKIYPKKNKDKNFIIYDLEINDSVAHIKYDGNEQNLVIPLSKMNFSNVGNSANKENKFQHYKDIMKLILNDIFLRIPDEKLRNLIKQNYKIK